MTRKQILIPRWLDAIIKNRAKKIGVSYAEIVRAGVCRSLIVHAAYLGYDAKGFFKTDAKSVRRLYNLMFSKEELKEHFDSLYYECRKADAWRQYKIDNVERRKR